MENKGYAKKIVCLAICLVLALAACIIGHDFNAVCVGSGSSSNAEINSMKQMGAMMSAFSSRVGGDELIEGAEKYESFTVKEISSSYCSISRGNGAYTKATSQRFMNIGVTKDAMYYHSEYTLSSDARGSGGNSDDSTDSRDSNYIDGTVDIDVYVGSERILIRFNNITFARNGKSLYGFERVVGQWGDFTDEPALANRIISTFATPGLDFKIMSLIGSYVGQYHSEQFNTKGNTHSMKSDAFKDFAASLMGIVSGSTSYLGDSFTGGMEIDLGSSSSPMVTLDLKSSYSSDKNAFSSDRVTVDMSETDILEFSNINNTVIKGYDDVSTISAEKVSEIMEELK